MNAPMRILITGGGTGGHVFPAIAIADAIKGLHPDVEVLFIGAKGKMEMERVPKAGYPIKGLPVAGFYRTFNFKNLLRNLVFPFKLIHSLILARNILQQFKPQVVVGTGGYASGPVMRAAQRVGIPTLIQEQNSYAGMTNRLLAERAVKICVAYEGMEQYFPAEKIELTGNPVRASFDDLELKRQEALKHFGLHEGNKTIGIIGGSLGARSLNEALRENAPLLAENIDRIQVLWQCGRIYENQYKNTNTARLGNVKILPFVERMDLFYAACDVVVSRAGALTISELCLVGLPVVLVPSPNVAEDHQTKNAKALVNKGAAIMVSDADTTAKMLPEALRIAFNPDLAATLSRKIKQLGRPNADSDIASEVLKLIK